MNNRSSLKKTIIFISLILVKLSLSAQNTMNIFQGNGTTISLPTSSIDSVRFSVNGLGQNQVIYQNNFNILSISIQDIDSINYAIPNQVLLPTVITSSSFNITSSSCIVGGEVLNDGGTTVIARGVCYSIIPNPTIANNHTNDGTGIGIYYSTLTPLLPNSTYYVRSYATNLIGTSYGNEIIINTNQGSGNLPTISSLAPTLPTHQTVITGGDITSDGGSVVTTRGVCWSIGTTPTINNSLTNNGQGIGTFSSIPKGLLPNTTYFVRAFATNNAGTAYGSSYSFTTNSRPIISTNNPTVSYTSISISANLINNSGSTVIGNGYCYGLNPQPNFSGQFTINTNNPNNFSTNINGLQNNTTYFVRAYGIFDCGNTILDTIYGNEISFTTMACTVPTVWDSINSISYNSANIQAGCGFNCQNSPFTIGVCWSTSPNPTINNDTVINSNGFFANFATQITNLTAGTVYYVRAFGINSIGVGYGNQLSFSTLAPLLPTVTTSPVSGITDSTAYSGGNITSNGFAPILSRGVCWSTTPNPTITNSNFSIDSSGIGSFISQLNGLVVNTTYYVRAYATNLAGTSYGNQISFNSPNLFTSIVGAGFIYNGYNYSTVQYGNGQEWMSENLRTSYYSNGDLIPGGSQFMVQSNGSWCYYNDDSTFVNPYGKLYNQYAIFDSRNVCPINWHVPSRSDWYKLFKYLDHGGTDTVSQPPNYSGYFPSLTMGGLLQNFGTGLNQSGFSAYRSGYFNYPTNFLPFRDINIGTSWWGTYSSTQLIYFDINGSFTCYPCISGGNNFTAPSNQYGFSVRCIKN
jgi:uncharacterized protein (TIGR02145 family)